MNEQEEAQQVIDDAISSCIEQQGVHVTEVSGLGTIITDTELDEEERLMLVDFAEALRVKRSKKT